MRKISRLLTLLFCLITPLFAFNEGQLIMDDEAELVVQDWLDQLGKAAGMKGHRIHPYFIISPEVNAVTTVGGRIYIFTGLFRLCPSAAEFLGVLAHEVGHIRGGHVARADSAMQNASMPAMASILLGGALALATGDSSPLVAGVMSGANIHERQLLKFSRTNETAADLTAISLAKTLNWPGLSHGLVSFLKRLEGGNFMSMNDIDPYLLTHPTTPERLQALMTSIPEAHTLPAGFEEKYQRIRAKFIAFLFDPRQAMLLYPPSDTSLPARYAQAILAHRQNQNQQALQVIDSLLKEHPKDPYFLEVKGQILMENGKYDEAKRLFRQVLAVRPKAIGAKLFLCQILVDQGSTGELKEAEQHLRALADVSQENTLLWRLLARVYGRQEKLGMANWALAEEAYLLQDPVTAKGKVEAAMKYGIHDAKAKTRCQDILQQVENG